MKSFDKSTRERNARMVHEMNITNLLNEGTFGPGKLYVSTQTKSCFVHPIQFSDGTTTTPSSAADQVACYVLVFFVLLTLWFK